MKSYCNVYQIGNCFVNYDLLLDFRFFPEQVANSIELRDCSLDMVRTTLLRTLIPILKKILVIENSESYLNRIKN